MQNLTEKHNNHTPALIVYILYLVSLFTGGLAAIIGLVIAYIYRDNSRGSYLESHFTYQIRTFWIGLLYLSISVLLCLILIGYLLLLAVFVWEIVRCVKGLQALNAYHHVDNVNSWLI